MNEAKKGCCIPRREGGEASPSIVLSQSTTCAKPGETEGMIRVDGGKYRIGYEGPGAWESDGEGPFREITLDSYWLDQTAVTNAKFAEFVEDTGYLTESEKFGWAFVFIGQLSNSKQRKLRETKTVQGLQWWYAIEGAHWRKPEGAGSTIKKKDGSPRGSCFVERRPCLRDLGGQASADRSRMGGRRAWTRECADHVSLGHGTGTRG